MLKKIGVSLGLLFLFFELLYFNSNSAVANFQNNPLREQVYEVSVEEKDAFLADYQDIIVEEKEDSILVLTSSQTLTEIQEKYSIKIENK